MMFLFRYVEDYIKELGPNFDLDEMLATLLESVNQNIDEIRKPITKENNPLLDFCIDFADTYEDRSTNKNTLTNEEYSNKIENMLSYLRQILLNDSMVSYVGKEEDEHRLNLVESKRTKEQTRFWNQSIAKNFLNSYLSEINKGL
jgi:endonuclease IV